MVYTLKPASDAIEGGQWTHRSKQRRQEDTAHAQLVPNDAPHIHTLAPRTHMGGTAFGGNRKRDSEKGGGRGEWKGSDTDSNHHFGKSCQRIATPRLFQAYSCNWHWGVRVEWTVVHIVVTCTQPCHFQLTNTTTVSTSCIDYGGGRGGTRS